MSAGTTPHRRHQATGPTGGPRESGCRAIQAQVPLLQRAFPPKNAFEDEEAGCEKFAYRDPSLKNIFQANFIFLIIIKCGIADFGVCEGPKLRHFGL